MGNSNNKADGRRAHCFLLDKLEPKVAAGNLELGHLYFWVRKGASSALPEKVPVYFPFYCDSTIAVAEDDEVYELSTKFIGFANDKSVSYEKTTTDATVDQDEDTDYVTDGSVSVSGAISGYDMIEDAGGTVDIVRSRFTNIIDSTGDDVEFVEAKTTSKDALLIVWQANGAEIDSIVTMELFPCFITTNNHESSYGSPQGLSFDFQGCSTTDYGLKRGFQKAKWKGIGEDAVTA